MSGGVSKPRRVELGEPLKGCHVLVDADSLDMGLLEDIQSGDVGRFIRAVARAVVGGDACPGLGGDEATRLAALRRLKPDQFAAVFQAMQGLFSVPKTS